MTDKVPYDEETLLAAFREKKAFAYAVIFHRYIRSLCYFVETVTNNTQAAQDIATESFLKVFERTERFTSIQKLKSFLFTTANNAALDWLKFQKRQQIRHQELYAFSENTDDAFEKRLIMAEVVQVVYNEIENLPAQVREVIRLSLIEDKSLNEVALQMNIAYKTVQNHKTKGLNLLRAALAKNKMLSGEILLAASCLLNDVLKA